MAGSYRHITTKSGKFRGTELLDNMGDAYEALEECFGMIQLLADFDQGRIQAAANHYEAGLVGRISKRADRNL